MSFFGFIIALVLFFHCKRRVEHYRRQHRLEDEDMHIGSEGAASWHEEWHRQWAAKFHHQTERRLRHLERQTQRRLRRLDREARRFGFSILGPATGEREKTTESDTEVAQRTAESDMLQRARRRAAAEAGFYSHLMSYLGVIAFLALINLLTTRYPWFIWPALGWGIGLFSHYMAVFGSRASPPRKKVPVSAWPSPRKSSKRTKVPSTSSAKWAAAQTSSQLDELKRARKRTLLPLLLPRTAAAS